MFNDFIFIFYLTSWYHELVSNIIAGIVQYNIKYLKYLSLAC